MRIAWPLIFQNRNAKVNDNFGARAPVAGRRPLQRDTFLYTVPRQVSDANNEWY